MKRAPWSEDLVGQLSMAALARGSQPPVQLVPPGLDIPLAFRTLSAFLSLFDASALVIVGRVIGRR
jgi:hypothetical protein